MTEPLTPESALDDRSPFDAARAVVLTIARLSPELPDPGSVWSAIIGMKGRESRAYLDIIVRTRHSIFYDQMQELYEFGMARVPPEARPTLCFECGRTFTAEFFAENLFPLLRMALTGPGSFQEKVVGMVEEYLYRYAGTKYVLAHELRPDGIVLAIENRWPDLVDAYLRRSGLDPDRSFRNSFDFIAGAVDEFACRVVEGVGRGSSSHRADGRRGEVRIPVPAGGRFASERLLETLLAHLGTLEARGREAVEAEEIEKDLIIGTPLMRDVLARIRKASRSDGIVLLGGESGTGKTLVAGKIHEMSRRRRGPFVVVGLTSDIGSDDLVLANLFGHERGAFTGASGEKQGLFSLADGGTIFLDEIGDASEKVQASLLRVIETSTFKRVGGLRDIRVDVRVIAATNRDLEARVAEGKFRRDLYYRLNVIPIRLPPLRERIEEIPALADYLLARARLREGGARKRLAPGLGEKLKAYDWPGNIRELDHALRHALAMGEGEEIVLADLPESLAKTLGGMPQGAAPRPAGAGGGAEGAAGGGGGSIIDGEALRAAIRRCDPVLAGTTDRPHEVPGHVDHAKRAWLAALIDEFHGDLALIGRFWDRGSEKTLRKLIASYGLAERLEEARARGRG
jgi:DNA-binding NtrC family response regulator